MTRFRLEIFFNLPQFLKTFLLHDPQSENLLLVNLDLLTELIDLFRGIQEPAELAVGDHVRLIRLLWHDQTSVRAGSDQSCYTAEAAE